MIARSSVRDADTICVRSVTVFMIVGCTIDEEKCRLTLMAQASQGTKMPIEFFVNTEMADAWNALPPWQAITGAWTA